MEKEVKSTRSVKQELLNLEQIKKKQPKHLDNLGELDLQKELKLNPQLHSLLHHQSLTKTAKQK